MRRPSRAPEAVTATIAFTARGLPVAQGSVKAFVRGGHAVVVGVSSPLAAWRHAIATEARNAMGDTPTLTGPVVVSAWFTFSRPPSHLRRDGTVKSAAPRYPPVDADKLARATGDALSGVVYRDDKQIVVWHVHKAWDDDERGWQGVEIRIREEEL